MKYNHNYTMNLSIGYSGADHEAELNPANDSSYSEEEWNALSEEEQMDWMYAEAHSWAQNYLEISVTP